MPPGCIPTSIAPPDAGNTKETVTVAPNPFRTFTTIIINNASQTNNYEFRIYNFLGIEVMHTTIMKKLTKLETGNLSKGIYFYKMIGKDQTIHSGKLVSK